MVYSLTKEVRVLHQFLTGATMGDAITSHALSLRDWLRESGFESHIYAEHIHDSIADQVRPLAAYRPSRRAPFALYHHSIGSQVADFLVKHQLRIILIYHNVTPPGFFQEIDPAWTQMAQLGERQLRQLKPHVELALAVSGFNDLELHHAGYDNTGVMPIALERKLYDIPSNKALAASMASEGPKLLFIGRLSPNKKQEDLVKLLYFYHRIEPDARLILVGDPWVVKYDQWVLNLAADLGLAGNVTLTGKVSQQDMVTYYRNADLFISMSEHEGFGKPFIESMYLELPILAFDSTAVPYTLGEAGVLFGRKNFDDLAELVDILISDHDLRQRIIAKQRQRARSFLAPQVKEQFLIFISQLKLQ